MITKIPGYTTAIFPDGQRRAASTTDAETGLGVRLGQGDIIMTTFASTDPSGNAVRRVYFFDLNDERNRPVVGTDIILAIRNGESPFDHGMVAFATFDFPDTPAGVVAARTVANHFLELAE
ncbi:hypothetical protein EniLVp02_0219 [Vibrio phage EniLVp02]